MVTRHFAIVWLILCAGCSAEGARPAGPRGTDGGEPRDGTMTAIDGGGAQAIDGGTPPDSGVADDRIAPAGTFPGEESATGGDVGIDVTLGRPAVI